MVTEEVTAVTAVVLGEAQVTAAVLEEAAVTAVALEEAQVTAVTVLALEEALETLAVLVAALEILAVILAAAVRAISRAVRIRLRLITTHRRRPITARACSRRLLFQLSVRRTALLR
jgi:hypothetical protein